MNKGIDNLYALCVLLDYVHVLALVCYVSSWYDDCGNANPLQISKIARTKHWSPYGSILRMEQVE